MYDQAKYLIHADITADGVVERSDVVGAVFGQTEGLLGEDLDLRDLQESQKLGRIDVEITSEDGQSFGEITIASGLDRVETAILAAALETIERVGPCRATVEVTELEDVRSAKRRDVVERATQLLAEFDESSLSSQDIVEEVREAVRVADITEFHGFPAGPRVGESDAVIVVEGRADVLTLLRYGVKNAIAVEGTDVPEEVAQLTRERTVTAFLDGDRGGDLILKELAQVGDIDHVALAPTGRSVEDLSRGEVMTALREKVPFEAVDEADAAAAAATDGSARPAPDAEASRSPEAHPRVDETDIDGTGVEEADATTAEPATEEQAPTSQGTADEGADAAETATDEEATAEAGGETTEDADPTTLSGHVADVIGDDTGQVRLLDETFGVLGEGPAEEAFELLDDAGTATAAVVLDGELTQRVLDVAAQRGVPQVVAASEGEYVKQPTAVRVRTAAELQAPVES
ncbi:DNA primase [Halobacteriales archaeon QH_7_68_42]|nr:MAG: DNA primase [Halobacteriales archaeon QH_7_68_42]